MAMLAGLIPGIRELRAPLAGGYLWLCFLFLFLHDNLPTGGDHAEAIDPLFQIGAELSVAALLVATSVLAYLVGSLADEALRILSWSLPALGGRLRGHSEESRPWYGPAGTRISASGRRTIDRTVERRLLAFERELDQIGLTPGEGAIADEPGPAGVERELRVARTYLQAGEGLEILSSIDRCQSEAEFRFAITMPLAAITVYMAAEVSLLWLLAFVPIAVLAFQGYQRHVAAGDELATALSIGEAQTPCLVDYAASVEAAMKSVQAEADLRQRTDQDPMAAYALGRRLEDRQDLDGALEAYKKAANGRVVKAHAAMGMLYERRGERGEAERAYGAGDSLGDAQASLRLATLLSASRGVEAEEALERAASRSPAASRDADGSAAEPVVKRWDEDDYRRASAEGDADATFNLALLLQRRRGVDNLREAAAVYRRAIEQGEASGRSWTNLGLALADLGDFPGALEAQREALTLMRERLGGEHPEVARSLSQLGFVLAQMGEFGEAQEVQEEAVEIAERTLGPDHVELAGPLGNLGTLLTQLGKFREAREVQERVLAIEERAYGPDHPETAKTLRNLATALRELGELDAARKAAERALAIVEKTLGPDHPDVAGALGSLGVILRRMGDLSEAREKQERALVIKEKAFGPNHPEVATSLGNLGNLLIDLGEYPEARDVHERALEIEEKAFGPNHPEVAKTLCNLGNAFSHLKLYEEARDAQSRALAIEEEVFGPDHAEVATTLGNYGNVLAELGDLQGARAALERALAIEEKAYAPDHPTVVATLGNLAIVLAALDLLDEAQATLTRGLSIADKIYGPDHPETERMRHGLSSVQQRMAGVGDLPDEPESVE